MDMGEVGGCWGSPHTMCRRPDPALQRAHVLPIPAVGPPLGTGLWGHPGASGPTRSALAGLTIFIPFMSFSPLDESWVGASGVLGKGSLVLLARRVAGDTPAWGGVGQKMNGWDATLHLTCPHVHEPHADTSVPFHGGWREEWMLSRCI